VKIYNSAEIIIKTPGLGVWQPKETRELSDQDWHALIRMDPNVRHALQIMVSKPPIGPPMVPDQLLEAFSPVDLESFRREDQDFSVKPLMVIMSVRRIPEVAVAFEKLSFIDKVYFRNFSAADISSAINGYLAAHLDEYTHILVSSDDITPTPPNIRRLILDVREYDVPVVAGYCNICTFNWANGGHPVCEACSTGVPHQNVNVTLTPVRLPPRIEGYDFLTVAEAEKIQGIRQVWFQGNACAMISTACMHEFPFVSYQAGHGGLMQDLALAIKLGLAKRPQFVDFRVGMRHYGTHHGRLLVGKEPSRIDFEKARGRARSQR
jgi:hypothetical protein